MGKANPLRILFVEDLPSDAELAKREIQKSGLRFESQRVDTKDAFLKALEEFRPDVIVSDYLMPEFDGMQALKLSLEHDASVPFIVFTGSMNEDTAVACMKAGATDYIVKEHITLLPFAVNEGLVHKKARLVQQEAERTLRASEERLRFVSETTGVVLYRLKYEDMKYDYLSPGIKVLTGYSADEINTLGFGILIQKTETNQGSRVSVDDLRKRREGGFGGDLHSDHLLSTKTGESKWVRDHSFPWRDAAGVIIGSVGILQDVTESKAAEENLRKLSSAIEMTADSVVITNKDGIIEYVNPAFEKLTGHTRESVLGKTPRILKSGLQGLAYYQEMWATILSGSVFHSEVVNKNKKGELFHETKTISPIFDADGTITHFVAIGEDITEKKLLEQQILRSQRMESLGTLASGVAHDLNNILAPVLLSVEILKNSAKDENSKKTLETLEASVYRGSAIVKQILAFARGVQGERALMQLRHLVDETMSMVREAFPKSVSVRKEVPKNIWAIHGDATQLHQLIMNLCINARDAMPNGGTLTLRAENVTIDEQYARMHIDAKPGRFVMFAVEDTGTGMPPEVIDHIFEPFFTTKEVGKGTGLGLSTAYTVVKRHEGFINVYSELQKGTTFKVYLPAAEKAEEETIEPEGKKLMSGEDELILVVDDEASICQITRQTLEAFRYRVMTASDGTEAVALYASHGKDIALVLTDMMMPFMDGARTIRALHKLNPDVKVVASSGLTGDGHAGRDGDLGVDVFIAKPYSAETLLKTIHSVLHPQAE